MSKRKKSISTLKIPHDFKGFSYKELKMQLAVAEIKRDAMKESMKRSWDDVKALREKKKQKQPGKLQTLLSIGTKASTIMASGKVGMVVKTASIGLGAYKLFKGIRNKFASKKTRNK